MDSDIARLVDLLDELADLLTANSQAHWAEWVARDAAWLRVGDAYGLAHFLHAFGGMGSLNDIVLGSGPDTEKLRSLTRSAWSLASSLSLEADGDS
jgi:Domain of unknown function (DUF6966)